MAAESVKYTKAQQDDMSVFLPQTAETIADAIKLRYWILIKQGRPFDVLFIPELGQLDDLDYLRQLLPPASDRPAELVGAFRRGAVVVALGITKRFPDDSARESVLNKVRQAITDLELYLGQKELPAEPPKSKHFQIKFTI